jgi:predicted transcriptional regulator of viral defense system
MFTLHTNSHNSSHNKAIAIFKSHGGMLRTTQAMRRGIHPSTLYGLRDSGELQIISRGLYRLSDSPPMANPDLLTVASRIPGGVICLISALAFHELTTQIPHEVHLALPRGAEEPRLDFPPIQTYRFGGESFGEGVESHQIDGVSVRIYSPEKTIADCFKFRNRIGLDTVLEALRFYRERKDVNIDELMRCARICRVHKIIRPYLEALI